MITRVIIAIVLFILGGLLYLLVSVAHGNTALVAILGLALVVLVFVFLSVAVYYMIRGRRRRRRGFV